MKIVPITGTGQSITFFEDDTIDTVRQQVALAVNSHPDRLFLQVKGTFPKDYYSGNPKHWTELFYRLSLDGVRVSADLLEAYTTQVRIEPSVTAQAITREEWEQHDEKVAALYDAPTDFEEYRVLGVPGEQSFVLPLPPREVALPPARIPLPRPQSLFETFHSYEISEIKAVELSATATELVKRNYYPFLTNETPNTIEPMRGPVQEAQAQIKRLLDLDTPKHEKVSLIRAKWYIPLVNTEFTAPRARFEQMFYGMTVSKETPYIGYFTAKSEAVRHKFFVTDAKSKTPYLDIPMWKGWVNHTQPQRRKPTLLLYRGSARTSFDRIAVTDKDITVSIFRSKESKQTLEELKLNLQEWMKSLDALMPFVEKADIDLNRWELADLSLVASYSEDVREFDMHRFPCLQNLFGFQNDTFRLLRSEHSSDDISPQELQVAQLFAQDDAELTSEFLSRELNIPQDEADVLFARYQERAQDFDIEKSLRAYPTIKFSKNEAIIKFVTNIERTLQYVDILRHVLSSDADDVDTVCPRRMERVVPKVAIPQQEINVEGEYNPDDELSALLGLGEEEQPSIAPPPPRASKKLAVGKATTRTYNYFNERLQEFDPNTFDNSIYPSKCEKKKQVVVLTDEDRARIGEDYNYESAPESEKLGLEDPKGLAVCPPYWCMRDEIPLQEEQLVTGDDGELHCPVCDGKVRKTDNLDTLEYTVIVRDKAKYPDYMKYISSINQRRIPCCYQKPRAKSVVLEQKQDETYILQEASAALPSLRLAYIPDDLAKKLQVTTDYEDTTKQRRLLSAKKDVFRVGLGRPSKTLPVLLNDSTPILRPNEARDNLMQCSFYRTWAKGDIDEAYTQGKLSILEEVEYVTTFLKCEVILVNTRSGDVQCGFWSDRLGANSRTIVMLDDDILALVERKKERKVYKTFYNADLRKPPFAAKTLPHLRALHTEACSTDLPSFADAIKEVQRKGKTSYEVILDPFERIQAIFLPREGVLPIQPTSLKPDAGVPVRNGYTNVLTTELPTLATAKAFLGDTAHNQFKVSRELQDVNGRITEVLLVSGFRVPVQPEQAVTQEDAKEVLDTLRRNDEAVLVDGEPNKGDIALAQKTSYAEEIYQFLLYSLSKDLQSDDWEDLRRLVEGRSVKLYKGLDKWLKESAYGDATQSPIDFVNKVRKPCGQYTSKDSCNSSSLCGWHRNTCKIRVKPVMDREELLKRITKTLRDNDKQRALVLDDALSPFFSTILYLEMPHELIISGTPS